MAVVDFNDRIQQLFKAKLGLLGEEEDDGYLIAMLLKASHAFLPVFWRRNHWCVLLQVYFVFAPPDDGGHPVWLHHDLQAAQWIVSPAASKQKLWAGRAD